MEIEHLNLQVKTYSRMHSAGWISPSGDFIEIERGNTHDSVTHEFPGMPEDENYPSSYAVAYLGYVKVTNGFDFTIAGPINRDDTRVRTMTQFTAQSVIFSVKNRQYPFDIDEPKEVHMTPAFWTVKIRAPLPKDPRMTRIVDSMPAVEFIARYGPSGLETWMFGTLGMNESYIRHLIRRLISETRQRPICK